MSEATEVFVGSLAASAARAVVVAVVVARVVAAAAVATAGAACAVDVFLVAFLMEFVVEVVAIFVPGRVHHESFVGSDSSVVFLAHGSSLCVAIGVEGG